jgi:hypothetical protein
VGHRLGAVEEHRHAVGVRRLDDAPHRVHGAQGVRDVAQGEDADAVAAGLERRLEGVQVEDAAVVEGDRLDRGPRFAADDLPGHDVGVVLEPGDQHLVARREAWPHEAPGYQVDRLGGAAGEDHLAGRDADEARHRRPRPLVGRGRPLAEGVDAAVDVRRVALVEAGHRLDHRPGLLGRGRVVQVDQRVPVDLLVETGELGPHGLDVERRGDVSSVCEYRARRSHDRPLREAGECVRSRHPQGWSD